MRDHMTLTFAQAGWWVWLVFVLTFLASPITSWGPFRFEALSSSHPPRAAISTISIAPFRSSNPESSESTIAIGGASQCGSSSSRRGLLLAGLAWVTTTTSGALPSRAEETSSYNDNYEFGNPDCQTSCVRRCELRSENKKKTNEYDGECLDACVRSGQRYCHTTGGATRSRSGYVPTTREPTITSARPIPGIRYNANRGGAAWREL